MNDVDPTHPWPKRLALWALDNAWLIVVVLAAFAVRLHWNLEVHPPGEYIYSDMRGYTRRADGMFQALWGVREYDAFYPYGTHVMLWFLQWVGGRTAESTPEQIDEVYRFVAGVYAVYGAALAGYGYALARRASRVGAVVAPIVGLLLVCYYPLISLGGYFLSEVPFALCLTAASFHLVRMLQEGKARDAWAMGIWVALGVTLRPQILLSVAFIGVYWLIFRKRMPRATIPMWARALAPILLVLAFSAWRVHYHTGRFGLISENGKFNQVFGRCHNEKITAHPDTPKRRRTSFGPPPLIQLAKRAQRAPGRWPQLDPARETHFEYKGYIGDDDILQTYIDDCIAKTGWKKQVEYSAVNVAMQWRYNIMWPDSGKRPWQPFSQKWGWFVTNVLAVPALLGLLGLFFPRRHPMLGLLSLHLWALTMIGIFYIGGMRFRAPYDPIIIIMAAEVYVLPLALAFRWLQAKRAETKPANPGSES
ncbi:MAG: hypothetical protein ACE37F_26755 [Nannocystaceae bacterium]|nr:hypothetical protein [bacterium]